MRPYLLCLVVAFGGGAPVGVADVIIGVSDLQPESNTAWDTDDLGLSGVFTLEILAEMTPWADFNGFYLDEDKDGFGGGIGSSLNDTLVFEPDDRVGATATLSLPTNVNLSLFNDISGSPGGPWGPNGILDTWDRYVNSDPHHNILHVALSQPRQFVKYFLADPGERYFFNSTPLGSGFVAFVFIDDSRTIPCCDYDDMIIGIRSNCGSDADCGDGLSCNGTEVCVHGVCQHGEPLDCSDGIDCTDDSCDVANDECVHTLDNSLCDDGLWCNGAETCDPTNDCQAGTAPDCDDGVGCTDDSCDEGNDACVHAPNDGLCGDGLWCNGTETCDPTNDCQPGTALDCDDGLGCTDDSCDEVNDTCMNAPNGGLCNDGNACTDDSCDAVVGCVNENNTADCDDGDPCSVNDTCAGGECIGTLDPENSDDDCAPDACDVCPNRPDCRFDPEGSCPDVAFYLAVLQESSGLSWTANDPPVALEEVLSCPGFVVEIWATKFSPDLDPSWPSDPGIACAFVDLVSYVDVAAEISMEWGELFDTLHSGTFSGNGGVTDLGACTTAEGGVGLWPEWVLLARLELEQDYDANVSFELQASAFGTSVFGQGFAEPVDYGEACVSTMDCRGHVYDLDSDCYIGPGDLGLFAGCWLLCPDDPGYDTGLFGESCDEANFAKCSADDCVGPEDFSFLMTAWQKHCDALDIELPDCGRMLAAQAYPPPLPSAEVLRSFGLEPPTAKWKGYRRGILRHSRELDVKRSTSRSTQR